MARKIIDIGIVGNDGTGDSIRDSFRKVNENFYEIYGSLGLGERLLFTNLGDTPDGYEGLQNNDGITPLVTTNSALDPTGLIFKNLTAGEGILIEYPTEVNTIVVGIDYDAIYSQELLAESIRLTSGVSVNEFSTDPTFIHNSTSTVPTEYAVRSYIDARLGIDHDGTPVAPASTIPQNSGFLPITGASAMRGNINLEDPDTPGTYYTVENIFGNEPDDIGDRDAVNKLVLNWAITDALTGGGAITDSQIAANADIQQSKLLLNISDALGVAPTGTAAQIQAASGLSSFDNTFFTVTNGWVSLADNGITYGKIQELGPRSVLGNDLYTNGGIVEIDLDDLLTGGALLNNSNIAVDADIEQSKLLLNLAGAQSAAPTGTAADKQAASGLSSVNSTYFTATDGWISLKTNGVTFSRMQKVNGNTVLGNSGFAIANVAEVTFADLLSVGGAIRKTQYTGTGFLRRKSGGSNTLDIDYEIIEMSSLNQTSKLIQRDTNGDFAARSADLNWLEIDNMTVLNTTPIGAGGAVQVYGWQGAGGILLASGPDAQDKTSYYDNNAHRFRTQAGSADAPIRCSSVRALNLTTGGETTNGTVTGRWTLTGASRMESTYAADLAEYYEGDKEYPIGTVLVFGGEKEITTTNKYMDTRIAGVVSDDAAFAMYKACPGHKNLVALQGRVPCKVVGKIAKGDLLVTASIPGVAISAKEDAKAGSIIGKALENYDSDHIGVIEAAVGRS